MKKNILYWPGRGQDTEVLKEFRKVLSNEYLIDIVNFEYDRGSLEPQRWNILQNKYSWWIGISLGASLEYYSYNYIELKNRPNRITLINPFSSRKILSEEKKFDISSQWDFAPRNSIIKVEKIDLVSSIFDTKIPMYHGIDLLDKAISNDKEIVFVNSNHTIDEKCAQIQLANILLGKSEENAEINYCNIYKQFRKK